MKKSKQHLKSRKLGVSYTVSAVIMTATAITLSLVAWSYANQTLAQQRGSTEFDVTMESILAFNDAFENIAWKPQSSRSARFILDYGQLQLIPDLDLDVNIANYLGASYSGSTGYLRYRTQTKFVSFGDGYHSNFIGDDSFISSGAGTYAKGTISQDSDWAYLDLMYGIRVMKSSTVGTVDHVDIWIIQMETTEQSARYTELNLNAKCIDVTTQTFAASGNGYSVINGEATIDVQLGDNVSGGPVISDSITVPLEGQSVVFNLIIATVKVNI
jgi:hypothetical protein